MTTIVRRLQLSLEDYAAGGEAEQEHVQRLRALLQDDPHAMDAANARGHVTASAWVLSWDMSEVLLTHHAKLKRWFQLGGHVEPSDASVLAAAAREAEEEAGIVEAGLLGDGIFDIDVHPIPERGCMPGHLHFDVTYAFRAQQGAVPRLNGESLALAWVPLDEAADLTDDPAVRRMLEKTRKLKERAGAGTCFGSIG